MRGVSGHKVVVYRFPWTRSRLSRYGILFFSSFSIILQSGRGQDTCQLLYSLNLFPGKCFVTHLFSLLIWYERVYYLYRSQDLDMFGDKNDCRFRKKCESVVYKIYNLYSIYNLKNFSKQTLQELNKCFIYSKICFLHVCMSLNFS